MLSFEPSSNFVDVFDKDAMEQSEKLLHHCNLYTHRRANQALHSDLVSSKSVYMASTFSASRLEGHGARLSIRTKDPNNHSDTETGTLSMKKPLPLNSVGYFFWGTLQI